MGKNYNILYEGRSAELVEKKSRFIAHLKPVETEEEALLFIEEIKKKYWDARHNCYAYIIGENKELQRFSDDGEPSGTAGKPILEVLLGEDINNVVVVVTRYFGGVLLGTGGLVRAYGRTTKLGLEASVIKKRVSGYKLVIHTDYNGIGKIQYIVSTMGIANHNEDYAEDVTVTVLVSEDDCDRFVKQVTEATAARAVIDEPKECYFLE
ncbi:MAG: YigZ family protein [Lachnospiraceae bacterium]|nr:YigZ family protein [Lachnospiraceae bacterium]